MGANLETESDRIPRQTDDMTAMNVCASKKCGNFNESVLAATFAIDL